MRQHRLNNFRESSEGERRQALIAFGIPARQGGVFVCQFVCFLNAFHVTNNDGRKHPCVEPEMVS